MMRDDDTFKADALLVEHYHWQKDWRPSLGTPRCAPECRQAVTSRQWDSTEDLHDSYLHKKEMEAVEWCLDELPSAHRQSIGIEMRNREVKAKVWRAGGTVPTFADALALIMPLMRKKSLF